MDFSDAAGIVRQHLEAQFPKRCTCCGELYPDLGSYVRNTQHLGEPMSYDADAKDFRPSEPLGAAAFSNCRCGSTLVVTSDGIPLETMWSLLAWLKSEMDRRHRTAGEILMELRAAIDAQLLGSSPPRTNS